MIKLIGLIITFAISIDAGCLWNCKLPSNSKNQEILPISPREKTALISLYNATNGRYWKRNDNWLKGDPCIDKWSGIVCSIDFETKRGTIQKM